MIILNYDYSDFSKVKFKAIHGEVLKIPTNEIRQIIYFLVRAKEITKKGI